MHGLIGERFLKWFGKGRLSRKSRGRQAGSPSEEGLAAAQADPAAPGAEQADRPPGVDPPRRPPHPAQKEDSPQGAVPPGELEVDKN